MAKPRFLACDWGAANLRAWVIADDSAMIAGQNFVIDGGRT